jgi:hypothetical protein
MYLNETNEYGCPLRDQTGSVAVQNFDAIVALLAPELRAAFEAEREALQAELDRYLSASPSLHRDATDASADFESDPDAQAESLTSAQALFTRLAYLVEKLDRVRLRDLIDGLRPRIAAQQ